jgi:hypothetical protein
MAKAEVKAEVEPTVKLSEFCIRQSSTGANVAMLGSFDHEERKGNRLRDTYSAYLARFEAFKKQPA